MNAALRRILFLLFFLSGFCGLVYQVIWTRLAFAAFGIITPVLSVVIAVFMLGLSLGSWLGGRWIGRLRERTGVSAVTFYGATELLIGLGAFAVPHLFALGEQLLLPLGQTDSARYLFFSAVVLACSIFPWCLCLGATTPLIMAFIRERHEDARSFSFLYLANVLGAMTGTLLTALVLVELLGFRNTLRVAAAFNFLIAGAGFALGRKAAAGPAAIPAAAPEPAAGQPCGLSPRAIAAILFATGFSAMAMEVVWTRAFVPVLKTEVYSFAEIVFAYLAATAAGSFLYRRDLRRRSPRSAAGLISLLVAAAFLPIVFNDPRIVQANWDFTPDLLSSLVVLGSLCPLCAILGYLTPLLVDEYAAGHPARAGRAYAVNVLGCIAGPCVASYLLLPQLSERRALIVLCLPLAACAWLGCQSLSRRRRTITGVAATVVVLGTVFFTVDYEGMIVWSGQRTGIRTAVRRDYAASVISFGEARKKFLLVNGVGMTVLSPITKFMVHLPLALHEGKPESALIICFGMGTSYRSSLSWDIETTTVELVPSVPAAFGFYHEDAGQVVRNPKSRIVVDDGRRFLRRTAERYDLIVVDPPPPVQAAGSSLLYSEEFYGLAARHLKTNGIIQMWIPGGQFTTVQAIIRSACNSFPHVRCYDSIENWGIHILASQEPIPDRSAVELAARLPEAARKDLLEWSDTPDAAAYLQSVLSTGVPGSNVANPALEIRITDDRPCNEYYLLRSAGILK